MLGTNLTHPMMHWHYGYDRYLDGWAVEEMDNEQQRNGWHDALSADLEAQEMRDNMEDIDFWRKGC